MRAIDKKGDFEKYFYKRFVLDLRETVNFIIDSYENDTSDEDIGEFDYIFDCVSRRIDKHIALTEIIKNCGFWSEECGFIDGRLRLLSQALDMGGLPEQDIFIRPAVNYLEKNYLVGLPLFEANN